jgi:hypothetical protein
MGSQDEQTNLANSIINSTLQDVVNYCTISCSSTIDNTNITVIGGDATINISNMCSIIGAECQIKNILSQKITNTLKNTVDQKESNLGIFSLFGPSSNETANISNAIQNQISQLVTNNCSIGVNNSTTNTNVFAEDANLNLTIGNNGQNTKAQCALDTVTKLVLNNSITNDVSQSESSCGAILGILIAIIIICIIFLAWPLLSAIFGAAGAVVRAGGNVVGGVGCKIKGSDGRCKS